MVAVRARGLGQGGGLFLRDIWGRTKSEPCDSRQSLLFLLCTTWTRASAVRSLNRAICYMRTKQRHCCFVHVVSSVPQIHWLFLLTGTANYNWPLLWFGHLACCFPAPDLELLRYTSSVFDIVYIHHKHCLCIYIYIYTHSQLSGLEIHINGVSPKPHHLT